MARSIRMPQRLCESAHYPRRVLRICLGASAAVVALLLLLMAAGMLRIFWEQWHWLPRDASRFRIATTAFGTEGVAVSVSAPTGVADVWEQGPEPGRPWAWLTPWEPKHHRVPFRVVTESEGRVRVLIRHSLRAGDDLLLAVMSSDGLWDSADPYLPATPDLSDPEWRALVGASLPGGAQ